MNVLAIDAACDLTSIAITRGSLILGELALRGGLTHVERLLPEIRGLLVRVGLGLDEVEAFAVTLGPGSFTGVRVGLATIQGLVMAQPRPVVGVSSLFATALHFGGQHRPVAVLLDPRRGQIYCGVYDTSSGRPVVVMEDQLVAIDQLGQALPEGALLVGAGLNGVELPQFERVFPADRPVAGVLGCLAEVWLNEGKGQTLADLQPMYLRLSEAQRKLAEG